MAKELIFKNQIVDSKNKAKTLRVGVFSIDTAISTLDINIFVS